ncbi:CR3L4 protein, partial [Fregetta grallaria]|nr:CR3L4 protein [Fregetta grallaria]
MSCPEKLAALIDEDLLNFLLKDGTPCLEMLGEENGLPEDWNLPESELLGKEMDDFISSLLRSFEDEPGMLQGYLPAISDSGISEDQHLSYSPGSDFAGSPQSSDAVQVDHNYSLHWDWPVLESVRSDMAGGGSSGFPVDVVMDVEPQLMPGAVMQVLTAMCSGFPELVLTKEERHLLKNEGSSLPTCLPLTRAEEGLLKKVRRKIRNKQSVQDNRRRKIYMDSLENRVAACTAQNHELEKKVQVLQKRNTSLFKQLQKLRTLVRRSATKTTAAKTCSMIVLLSFCFILSPSVCFFRDREPQVELRAGSTSLAALSQQIRELPNEVAPTVQEEDAALEGFSPDPEDPSLLGSLNQSRKKGQSPPDPDPKSFDSNSFSDLPAAAGSELGSPQPQEQPSQSNPLQAVVDWKTKIQKWVERGIRLVIQQHHADEG